MRRRVLLQMCALLCVLAFCAHICLRTRRFWTPQTHLDRPVATVTEAWNHRRRRWRLNLQPWASHTHLLQEEAQRFLLYISTAQVTCEAAEDHGSWSLCLDRRFSLERCIRDKRCRVYSLRLGGADEGLERSLAGRGCEVHCLDPSLRDAHHLQEQNLWLHRVSVDWRDARPGQNHRLSTILTHFGHTHVEVLKLDVEGAEWKILENLLLEGVLEGVALLLVELHLHWAGFEVGGAEPAVVRYWFSLLKELEGAGFRLYHAHRKSTAPPLLLQPGSGSYTLGWVNLRFSPPD